ncbi:hypothetical protein EV182_007097, partial [Spiromyces aspiralis]
MSDERDQRIEQLEAQVRQLLAAQVANANKDKEEPIPEPIEAILDEAKGLSASERARIYRTFPAYEHEELEHPVLDGALSERTKKANIPATHYQADTLKGSTQLRHMANIGISIWSAIYEAGTAEEPEVAFAKLDQAKLATEELIKLAVGEARALEKTAKDRIFKAIKIPDFIREIDNKPETGRPMASKELMEAWRQHERD